MLTELKTDYTGVESTNKSTKGDGFVSIDTKSSWGYTHTPIFLLAPKFTSVSPKQKQRIAAPLNLKRAMFRMSSRAMANVLQ